MLKKIAGEHIKINGHYQKPAQIQVRKENQIVSTFHFEDVTKILFPPKNSIKFHIIIIVKLEKHGESE